MDQWFTTFFNACISGLVVGLIVAVFKVKFEQGAKKVEEANDLKISHLSDEIQNVWEAVKSVKVSQSELSKELGTIGTRVAVMVSEQRIFGERLSETNSMVRSISERQNEFGKVIRK